jgi:hypothetical protein
MKRGDDVLKNEKKASTIFATIDVNVTKVYAMLTGFPSYVNAETLRESSFACANVACYYDSLGHSFRCPQGKIEEFS